LVWPDAAPLCSQNAIGVLVSAAIVRECKNRAITSETYGHWSHEMGDRAASLREAWASRDKYRGDISK
jgi:hypothetical protein